MLASKKIEERAQLNEDLSSQAYATKQRQSQARARKINFTPHPSPRDSAQERHGGNWSANSDTRGEGPGGDKKAVKTKKAATTQPLGNRIRANKQPTKPANPTQNNLNKYRIQIRKFLQNIEEYRKLEDTLKSTHDTLVTMRKELLDSEVEPGEIPDVQSSIQDMIHVMLTDKVDDQTRLVEVEKECSEIKEAFFVMEEEKRKLEETLDIMNVKLKCKEEELIKVMENDKVLKVPVSGEGDIDEIENLKKTINLLDQENSDLMDKLKRFDDDKSEGSKEDQKIRSLEKLIETLHVDIKKLKDQLKIEKECRAKLDMINEKLKAEVNDLKSLSSSSDSKYIILEKDNKIQDLQNRLNEISRVRPHQTSVTPEVFKVDFSADNASLVNQLAKFVQLYEELSREGFDLESKLKDAHMEIYRLEQILEKQLSKIKEQDDCLKNMEQSLSKVIIETRKTSRVDQVSGMPAFKCKCDEFEVLIKEKEEFSEKLKEKMSLLYQKYKQYKSECNMMRKKLDAFEKRSWLKKLVNI